MDKESGVAPSMMADTPGIGSLRGRTEGKADWLRLDLEKQVALITLYRPPTNALTLPLVMDLRDIVLELDKDPEIRCLVITGGVRNAFSSGGDLEQLFSGEMAETDPAERAVLFDTMQACFGEIEQVHKPTVAAINGVAIGGGLELALVCDFRVASELAYFALPELAHGIIPGLGATFRLPYVVGAARAKEMLMLGRRLRAEEALSWGLVHRLASHGSVVEQAMRLAHELALKPPHAFSAVKRSIYRSAFERNSWSAKEETREFVSLLARKLNELRNSQ